MVVCVLRLSICNAACLLLSAVHLYDAVINVLYELSCGLVAEYRLLALSLRACRVRDVVFCTVIWTRFL